ncbi:MAG: DNA gyrase/topoisomerase IV subunit B [Jatrophihabitans sp.]|uniref:DNA gyrase/topoisomerase IV subunit B n=1 Tax=Jatrophihabitans sp. TaxID=1932789 RepID=UPI003F7D96C9
MKAATALDDSYDADDIVHLRGLDAVRKRPGMYIGSTDSRGVNHLVSEILDNSVDEAVAGFCSRIEVTLHPDGSVEVADDGRGIPVGMNTKAQRSALELVLSELHAGGKFSSKTYNTSGGLHGVGAAVVNALSLRLDATVRRDGKVYEVSFRHGVAGEFAGPGPKAKFTASPGLRVTGRSPKGRTGTSIRYWYDPAYFDREAAFQADVLVAKMRNTAFLVQGLTLVLRDAREGSIDEQTFHYPGGLSEMVEFYGPPDERPVTDTVIFTGTGSYRENAADEHGVMQSNVERTCEVEVALRWGTGYSTVVESFTNVIGNANGGTHRKGFERALTRTIVEAVNGTRGLLKPKEPAPVLDDIVEGMTAVVHVRVPEPQFTSQTKDELSTAGVGKAVQAVVEQGLKGWLTDRKSKAQARVVLEKIVNASRVRIAEKGHKDAARRKTALEGASMPAKLADCRSTGVERSELFLVEGDSAAGSAKKGRSAEYQAILPLRGKVLNVQKASLADAFKDKEIASIIQVLGAGSGRSFDLASMRYGRVMIMADADVDGSHIRVLLITLIYKYLTPVIESGRLFAAMPPLHQITTKGRTPETIFTYTQAEMEQTVARLEAEGKQVVKPIQRFKGLGEMDAAELWATTMDPARRTVRRITMEDAAEAERVLELLMGNKVEPRKDWLVEYSDQVDREAIDA